MIPRRLQRETMSSILTFEYACSFLIGMFDDSFFFSSAVASTAAVVEYSGDVLLIVRRADVAMEEEDVRCKPKPKVLVFLSERRNMDSAMLR